MNPLTQSKDATILPVLIALTLACFALSHHVNAECPQFCDNTNTALGFHAFIVNTTGTANAAFGEAALFSNTTGSYNVATGFSALLSNTTGYWNTATGWDALGQNTTGFGNTAYGNAALQGPSNGNFNTGVGNAALISVTGSRNIALGHAAGANLHEGDRNIDIGNRGRFRESQTIRIGEAREQTATFIAGIVGSTVPDGVGVIVGSNGQLGTIVSSERYKDEIKPMDRASEAILALKPVTFHYKRELDPEGIPQFGLVAEQVEKVNPDLVARDEKGKPYTVRYEAVNAMLLNEFLKEHRKVEALEATVAAQEKDFKSQIAALTATLKAQAAQIQKVSDQLEWSTTAPRIVANNQ